MKRLKALIKKLFSHKFVRFLFAGGLNTLFSYICFVILMALINQKEIVTTVNLIIAVAFNYLTSSRIVFRDSKFSPITIAKFYGVYGITYVLNLLHLYITVDKWGWNVYVSQLITLCYMPIISFTLQRLLVFKNDKIKRETVDKSLLNNFSEEEKIE